MFLTFTREYIDPLQHPYPFTPEWYLEAGQTFVGTSESNSTWNSPTLSIEVTFPTANVMYFQTRLYLSPGFQTKYWAQNTQYIPGANIVLIQNTFYDTQSQTGKSWNTRIPVLPYFTPNIKQSSFSGIDPSLAPETILQFFDLPYYEAVTGLPIQAYAPVYSWTRFTLDVPAGKQVENPFNFLGGHLGRKLASAKKFPIFTN